MESEHSSSDEEETVSYQMGLKRLFSSDSTEIVFTPERVCKTLTAPRQNGRSSTDSEGFKRDNVYKQQKEEINDKASSSVSVVLGEGWEAGIVSQAMSQ